MKIVYSFCISLWAAVLAPSFAQSSFPEARRFAEKPNPDAPDSIQTCARFLQDNDSLRLWLVLHYRLATIRLYDDRKKDPEAATRWLDMAQKPWRQPHEYGEWRTWASLHTVIAYYNYKSKANLVEGKHYYEVARSIYLDHLNPADVYLAQHVLTPLGNVCLRLRDYEKAHQYLKEAQRISTEQRAWNAAAYATNALGMMYVNRGDYKKAGPFFQEGLALSGITPFYKILLLLNAGLVHLKQHDLVAAERVSREAEQLLQAHQTDFPRENQREFYADLHDNLGNIFQEQKNWAQAAYHFHQRKAMLQAECNGQSCRSLAQSNLQMADLFTLTGQPDSVLLYLNAALNNMVPTANLPDVLSNPDSSVLRPDQVFYNAFRRKIEVLGLEYTQNADPSRLYAIIETCERLFFTDELLRRQYDFDDTKLLRQSESHPYYAAAVDASYRLFVTDKKGQFGVHAWQYAEMAHERLLASSMQKHEDAVAVPPETQHRLDTLQRRRVHLMTQFFEARQGSLPNGASLETQLFEAHTAWVNLLDSISPDRSKVVLPRTDLAAVQKCLSPDQGLLQYFVADSTRIYVFVVTPNAFDLIECPVTEDFCRAIADLQTALTDQELRKLGEEMDLFKPSAGKLYDWLLAQPLALLPPYIKRLVVVPDGPLHEVPFELLGKAAQSDNFYAFPYLLRRFSVSYASSSQLFQKQTATARIRDNRHDLLPFVGFAPRYSETDTSRLSAWAARTRQGGNNDLPEARKEVAEIAGLLKGKAFLSEAAGEQQFEAFGPQARIVHLSMHALLNRDNPLFSKFLFSAHPDAPQVNNDLYALEIYTMRLPARMVVMSACETGLGMFQRGEGVMSLGRAFAHTGIPTILMSLWSVEDKSTRLIMVDFYRQILSGLPTDEALRLAKLQYLTKCSPEKANPFYWAGFIASGATSPVSPK